MAQVQRYSGARTIAAFNSEDALQLPVTLQAGNYSAGTVVGQITGTNTNDVQTITSTLTGGSFRLFVPLPLINAFTAPIAYSATGATFASNIQTALNTLIQKYYPTASVVVTGTGPFVVTFSGGPLAHQPIPLMTVDNTSATGGTATIAHTTTGIGPNGAYRAYASGNSDGSQNAEGILEYEVSVDAAGNIWLGDTVGASEFGQSELSTAMYINGDFDLADLVGLDSTALSAMQGRVVQGSLASGQGIVHFG